MYSICIAFAVLIYRLYCLHFSEDGWSPYFLVLEVIQVRHIHVPQGDLWVRGTGLIRINECHEYIAQWYYFQNLITLGIFVPHLFWKYLSY